MHIYIQRQDERIAKVELPDDELDVWTSLERCWPMSYDLIDEDMVFFGLSHWDEKFSIDIDLDWDGDLRDWIMEGRE